MARTVRRTVATLNCILKLEMIVGMVLSEGSFAWEWASVYVFATQEFF